MQWNLNTDVLRLQSFNVQSQISFLWNPLWERLCFPFWLFHYLPWCMQTANANFPLIHLNHEGLSGCIQRQKETNFFTEQFTLLSSLHHTMPFNVCVKQQIFRLWFLFSKVSELLKPKSYGSRCITDEHCHTIASSERRKIRLLQHCQKISWLEDLPCLWGSWWL